MSVYEDALNFVIEDTPAAPCLVSYHLCIFEMLEANDLLKMLDDVANGDLISSLVSLGTHYLLRDQGRYIRMATTVAMAVLSLESTGNFDLMHVNDDVKLQALVGRKRQRHRLPKPV